MKLIILLLGILLLLYLIVRKKWNAFIAMTVLSLAFGLIFGMNPEKIVSAFEAGIGSTLGSLTLVLGIGAMIAQLMEDSGAANSIAVTLIQKAGPKYVQWAVLFAGMLISFALFFDTAFILLIPIMISVAKKLDVPYLWVGMPGAISLITIHALFPPHPGAMAIIDTLGVNGGVSMGLGLIIAIPTMILTGILYTRFYFKRTGELDAIQNKDLKAFQFEDQTLTVPFGQSAFLMLLPIVLIAIGSFLPMFVSNKAFWVKLVVFIGNPIVALLIALAFAIVLLGIKRGNDLPYIMDRLTDSAKVIATVLLVNGAGGGLKQILMDTGATEEIVHLVQSFHLSPLFAGFIIAALMRVTLGSTTVAAITASGIVKEMLATSTVNPVLVMLSIAAGSMFFSHVNDPGFWLFKQYFDLDIKTTFKTWSTMTTIASLIAFIFVLGLSLFI